MSCNIMNSIKKLCLIAFFCTGLTGHAQLRPAFDDWFLTAGFNAVNSLGSLNPFYQPGNWAFRTPFAFSAEKQFARDWTLELAINTNGWKEGDPIDRGSEPDNPLNPGTAPQDFSYFAFDINAKWYFGRQVFRRGNDKIDLYANGGLGVFSIDGTNLSFNLGGGILFWLNEENTFGLRLQVIGKFAFDNSNSGYDNNHYQWGLHAIYRLD